ncbi:MAG: ABC transporter permease [Prolixibacteraceae bacterium]|nr:ABC transporter permease [Prolixibacteraceae bacterium]
MINNEISSDTVFENLDLKTNLNVKSTKCKTPHPFWVMVNKEITDHVRSWRFIILVSLIALTCLGSLYTAFENMGEAFKSTKSDDLFFFLKLFTVSDKTLPPFFIFISFLGPLLGISMGFDSINSEQNRGTLSRVLSQPIYRDYILNAKFTASMIVISVLFYALGFMVMGIGLIAIGIPPTVEEFLRIIFFIILSIFYVALWLNLSILFSVRIRQAATSALAGISVWLFFSIFYNMIVDLIAKGSAPSAFAPGHVVISFQKTMLNLMRISPAQLYSEATTTMLMPSVRSIGPLTMEQVSGAVPGPLPLGQSLLVVWPQVTGLIAVTILLFALAYMAFMRKEIRSR